MKATLLALALLTAGAPQAYAQAAQAPAEAPALRAFVTRHSGTFNGQKVKYVATVGETMLKDRDGVPTISFMTTAYVRHGRGEDDADHADHIFDDTIELVRSMLNGK